MDEASLCDRVALIQEGKILSIDSPTGIIKKFSKPLWAFKANDMYKLMLDLSAIPEVLSVYSFGSEHHVMFRDSNQTIDSITKKINHTNLTVKRIEPTIEDVFMDLMKSK